MNDVMEHPLSGQPGVLGCCTNTTNHDPENPHCYWNGHRTAVAEHHDEYLPQPLLPPSWIRTWVMDPDEDIYEDEP